MGVLKMKILLTGSTGYVGSAAYKKLKDQHEIYTVVRDKNSTDKHTLIWDFCNDINIEQLPAQMDIILHLAQSRHHREFPENAMDMFKVNISSTAALLDYAVKAGVKQFVLMSSGTVYEPYHGALQEDSLISPKEYYPVSKQICELLTKSYSDKFKICILRAFFIYGPKQQKRLIPELIRRVQESIPIILKGGKDGMTITPTHIDDVIHILNSAMTFGWEGILNVSSAESASIRGIGQLIGRLLKKDVVFQEEDQAQELPFQALSIVPELKNLAKFYSQPFISLEEGLRRTLDEGCVLKNLNEV